MSSVLFDAPGPRARARHRLYTLITLVGLLAIVYWAGQKLSSAGVLSSDVLSETFQDSVVRFLLDGLLNTLKAAALAIAGALPFGVLLAFGRLSQHGLIRWPSIAVIEFFRAVPLVLLMIILYASFRESLGSFGAVVVALILYNGTVLAEVYRAGIKAVQAGQSEAAYALGMRKFQVMISILLPQAVKFMLPAIVSQCVIVLKDTSLGVVVIYDEIVRSARLVAQFVDDGTILVYTTVAIVFIVINYSLSKVAQYLEHRLSRSGEKPIDTEMIESGVGQASG